MDQNLSHQTLAQILAQKRKDIGVDRKTIATAAGISHGYYGAIERGQVTAPNSTLLRIFQTLKFSEGEIKHLQEKAAQARGLSLEDAGLPDEVSGLIADIRKAAFMMPTRFVRHIRSLIRSATD